MEDITDLGMCLISKYTQGPWRPAQYLLKTKACRANKLIQWEYFNMLNKELDQS